MKFTLFLNHLSASQTINSRQSNSPLDCYATCSPYNCANISTEQHDSESGLRLLFKRMGKWKFRAEKSAYLVYDPRNNRLYETDEDGYSALHTLLKAYSYESFCDMLKTNKECNALVSNIKEVYI